MAEKILTSQEIGTILHPVFDEQIINYGAYNLVFAQGSATYRNPDIAALQEPNQTCFLVGYRDAPREVIIAPLALPEVSSLGSPTSIDNTNAVGVQMLGNNTFTIESTNGTAFKLSLRPQIELQLAAGSGVLDQQKDLEDFTQFLSESWPEDI